jgi:hypothetical protein
MLTFRALRVTHTGGVNPASQLGRDGRPLVPTDLAAYSLGMKSASFRSWAKRHNVTPAALGRPAGTTGQATAFWDLADLTGAIRAKMSN